MRVLIEDDPRSGRPPDSTDEANVAQVESRELYHANWPIKVYNIGTEVGVSPGSVETIIHNYLGRYKVSARWFPETSTLWIYTRGSPQVKSCLNCMKPIHPTFFPFLLQEMRPGYRTKTLSPSCNPCNGNIGLLRPIRSYERNPRQARTWPRLSGMSKRFC